MLIARGDLARVCPEARMPAPRFHSRRAGSLAQGVLFSWVRWLGRQKGLKEEGEAISLRINGKIIVAYRGKCHGVLIG